MKTVFPVLLFLCVLASQLSAARIPSWTEVPGPASTTRAIISGSAFVSTNDIWAVGGSGIQNTRVLIDHWDGANWAVSPGLTDSSGSLYSVSALSSSDVWAVGQTGSATLVGHWDGQNWRVVPSPNLGTYDQLKAVAAISANDIWAVGQSLIPGSTYLMMHWDGLNWSLVDGPAAASSALLGLKAFASNDVWAVGYKDYDNDTFSGSNFILHWDGITWTEIASPNVDDSNFLSGIDGLAPNDIWAVGNSGNGPAISHTLTLHWDGTGWSTVPTPVTGPSEIFYAIRASSPTNIWAVGQTSTAPLTELWTGKRWKVVPTPVVGDNAFLFTITGRGGNLWSSGRQGYPYSDELFLELTRSR